VRKNIQNELETPKNLFFAKIRKKATKTASKINRTINHKPQQNLIKTYKQAEHPSKSNL